MTPKTTTYTLLFVLALLVLPVGNAHAGMNEQSYEVAKEKNHGHVGIHKRRHEFREHLKAHTSNEENMANIAPAAGDEKETTQMQTKASEVPRYNQ